jgi:hypothetical protein
MATDRFEPNRSRSEGNDNKPEKWAKWLVGATSLALLVSEFLRHLRPIARAHRHGPLSSQARYPAASAAPIRDHERRDAHAGWIFGVVLFLFFSGLIIHGILAAFLAALKHSPPPTDAFRPPPRTARNAPALPAFPKLQISAPADLQAFRAREDDELNSYGWVNRTSGIVRIPIERAVDVVLQQGLPVRTSTNAGATGPSPIELIQRRLEHREPEIQGAQ